MNPTRALAAAGVLIALAVSAGCASEPSASSSSEGPDSSGIVTVEPAEDAAGLSLAAVDQASACELAARSATLSGLAATGTPADVGLVVELSMCSLRLDDPRFAESSIGLSILTSEDIAVTAAADPTTFAGTIVPLPDLGTDGHFIARAASVDPSSDPRQGTILSSRGDVGVSLTWALAEADIPFATFEQAIREMLDGISE